MNYKKISKANNKKFHNIINKYMEEIKAEKGNYHYNMYNWKINTKYGILYITIHDDAGYTIYSIFTRFEDTERSRPVHGNTYCSKWNFHYYELESCINAFKREMEKIII